jgi:Tfp pilus assembly protein PilV
MKSETLKTRLRPCSSGSRQGDRAGFSMIELVTALFVLTLGLFGTVQTYHVAMDKIRAARENAIAVRAIQNEVEVLRSMPFGELTDKANAPFSRPAPELDALVRATPEVSISPYGDAALRLKEVTVSVRWSGDNGRMITKAVTTLIADKEATS